jgi:catechol 2,3-dioxygenase-like lactoylglutathione lyase family enzyme
VRLRQLALITRDLDSAAEQVRSVLGLEVAYRDPSVDQFGLRNIVCPLGPEDFLEVVSPVVEDTPAARYLAGRGGDSAYMVLLQCPDPEPVRRAVERLGVRVGAAVDTDDYMSFHLHPKDCGGVLLSIDWAPGGWIGAGRDWQDKVRTGVTRGFRAIGIACPDAEAVAARWAALTGAPCAGGTLRLENAEIRFAEAAPGEDTGVRAVELLAGDGGPAGRTEKVVGVPFTFVAGGSHD